MLVKLNQFLRRKVPQDLTFSVAFSIYVPLGIVFFIFGFGLVEALSWKAAIFITCPVLSNAYCAYKIRTADGPAASSVVLWPFISSMIPAVLGVTIIWPTYRSLYTSASYPPDLVTVGLVLAGHLLLANVWCFIWIRRPYANIKVRSPDNQANLERLHEEYKSLLAPSILIIAVAVISGSMSLLALGRTEWLTQVTVLQGLLAILAFAGYAAAFYRILVHLTIVRELLRS